MLRRERLSLLILLAFVTLFPKLSFCQIGERPGTGHTIHVQIRVPGGHPAPQGVMVVLEEQDSGIVAQAQTDSLGKCQFNPPSSAMYRVIVKQVGYQEQQATADLQTQQSAYVMMELKPKPSLQAAAPGGMAPPPNVSEKALKEFQKGEKLLMKEQKPDESIPHLKKAINESKDYTDAYVMLGFAYLAKNNANDAKPVLEQAIKLDPKSWMAHVELGAAYNLEKKYSDAERELTAGLALNDKAATGHYELGKTYWLTGRLNSAELHAAKAVELAPDLAAAHVLLGNVRLRKQDYAGAKHEFEEYLRIEPKGPMAAGVHDMIDKLDKAEKQQMAASPD